MYFVFDENLCKFEGMTKEEIIAAIAEATGATPTSIDDAFITKIKEYNRSANLRFWKGTSAEYALIDPKDENTFYIITDDTTVEDIQYDIDDIDNRIGALEQLIPTDLDGSLTGFTKVTTAVFYWTSPYSDITYLESLGAGLYLLVCKSWNDNDTSVYNLVSCVAYYDGTRPTFTGCYDTSFAFPKSIMGVVSPEYRGATPSVNHYVYADIYAKKLF